MNTLEEKATITFTSQCREGCLLPGYVYSRKQETWDVDLFLRSVWDDRNPLDALAGLCEILTRKGLLSAEEVGELANGAAGSDPGWHDCDDFRLNVSKEDL